MAWWGGGGEESPLQLVRGLRPAGLDQRTQLMVYACRALNALPCTLLAICVELPGSRDRAERAWRSKRGVNGGRARIHEVDMVPESGWFPKAFCGFFAGKNRGSVLVGRKNRGTGGRTQRKFGKNRGTMRATGGSYLEVREENRGTSPVRNKRKQKKTVVNLNVTNVTFNHNATPPSLPTMSADLVLEYKFHNEQLFAIVKSYRSGQRVPRGGLDREAALARDTAHTTRARNN